MEYIQAWERPEFEKFGFDALDKTLEEIVWDWNREGFLPLSYITDNYFSRLGIKRNYKSTFQNNVIALFRNKGVPIIEKYTNTEGWKYDNWYCAFILNNWKPLFISEKWYAGICEQGKGYQYLRDCAEEEIISQKKEINRLNKEIKKLRFELKSKKDGVVITSEKDLENYLVDCCNILGWECIKQKPSEYGKGVPDRKIVKPDYTEIYVELKNPNKTGHLSMEQIEYHEKLRDQGYEVKVIWSKEQVDKLLNEESVCAQ